MLAKHLQISVSADSYEKARLLEALLAIHWHSITEVDQKPPCIGHLTSGKFTVLEAVDGQPLKYLHHGKYQGTV